MYDIATYRHRLTLGIVGGECLESPSLFQPDIFASDCNVLTTAHRSIFAAFSAKFGINESLVRREIANICSQIRYSMKRGGYQQKPKK